MAPDLVPQAMIEQKIFLVRGHKVMLSHHLAELYNVEARSLIQAVKRNKERFPEDFIFQLTWEELKSLRSQIVILNSDAFGAQQEQKSSSRRGQHLKFPPRGFDKQEATSLLFGGAGKMCDPCHIVLKLISSPFFVPRFPSLDT